jgi:ferrous-iron efflux pump FieF
VTAAMDPERRARLMRRATLASVCIAVALVLLKLVAWLVTGSAAVLSSLIDSLTDVGASVILLFSVRVSLEPPDRSHRFGHGKAEPLGAIVQGAFIAGSAILLIVEAAGRFVTPQRIDAPEVGVAATVVAMATTLALLLYQRHVVRVTGSTAIEADSVHYSGDVLTGAAVLLALFVGNRPGFSWVDPAIAIGIAGILLVNTRRIVARAIHLLMDHELPAQERDRIAAIVRGDPDVVDLHDLRTRAAGAVRFVELHVELDGAMTLEEAHVVTDRIEASLAEAFPGLEMILHQEPAGLDDDRLDHRIQRAPRP